MKYATAMRHLRGLVEALDAEAALAHRTDGQAPPVRAAYAFGAVLDGPDTLDHADVALVVDRCASDLPWGVEPGEVRGFMARHRLDRLPLRWVCRPTDTPVGNHRIVGPVRLWSREEGADDAALEALAARRADHLRAPEVDAEELAGQLERDAAVSFAGLDELVHAHRGDARAVAEELFELVWGYADLHRGLAALRGQAPPAPATPATGRVWDLDGYRQLRGALHRGDGRAVVAAISERALDEVCQLAGDGLLLALAQQAPGADVAAQRCVQVLRRRGWDGDDDLADYLDTARHTGLAAAQQAVPVDLDELGACLDGPAGGVPSVMWLRLATGELWPDPGVDDLVEAIGEALPHDWDDPDAWLPVEACGGREAHRDMEAFAAGVADRRLGDRLERCLHGPGAFRGFRELLADRDDEWARWQVFAAERVRGRARVWLAAHGYRPGPPRAGENG